MTKEIQTPQKKRIWEIDAFRGFLMLCLLLFHLYFTLDAFFVQGCYRNIDTEVFLKIADPFGLLWTEIEGNFERCFFGKFFGPVNNSGVALFFVISGVSCMFSRNNLKSGIRLLCAAILVSGFSKVLVITTGDEAQFIRFGALHSYALCHLIYYFILENKNNKVLLAVAAITLVIGLIIERLNLYSNFALLVPFGIKENGVAMRDYWPVFSTLGWFLFGVIAGRRWYYDKKTRFPSQENRKWHKPLRFLGRHSGLIYCGHMVVYTLVFCGAGYIFGLF